ncbi:unnamed protein product (macronuclear) [Paramecium tetraurelia]|uniref:Lysosomal dipeptide transporter MFSD1 n=1 Tax=Paramecium tetraurelia TaxID=5888 RepID=A0BN67_PARTE|nr:uncharacterized protein GSPATT00030622001 [Paramecium tetraurelia]CAK59984.1 unnamed protein product [Paramecium tetraurelia]|eukprot:XP_001427382.1 hypothetical protein (macronuclear) [Paramecium tetraurelia strain d4-2]
MKVNQSVETNVNKNTVYSEQVAEEQENQQEKSSLKYIVLILACLLMFGNNYSFDNPQALQRQLTQDLDISISKYNLLYTAFSFPNIFLTLIGGMIIDVLGIRVAITGFSAIVVIAQTIIAFGGLFKSFWIMLAGRVLFGSASESLLIAQTAMIGKWFRGKELSTAIGYIMTMPEIASAANSFVTPTIYDHFNGLTYPLFFSVFLCFLSFICGVVLCILDRNNDKKQKGLQFVYKDNASEKSEQVEKVSFKDIKSLNGTFWILILICTLAMGAYVPFLDDANDFLQEKFEFSYVQSGRILTLTYLAAAITSPFLGPYVDKVGKRRFFILITCLFFSATHFLFGFMKSGYHDKPNWFSIIPLITLGMSYSLYCCVLIPSVQYVVQQRVIGTAFGILGMFTSTSMALFPILAGYIVEEATSKEEGYSTVGFFYCGVSIFGLIFTISLYFFDKQSSIILDFVNPENPTKEEKEIMKSIKQANNEQLGVFEDIDDDLLKIEGEENDDDENVKNDGFWEKNQRYLVSSKGFSTPKLAANKTVHERTGSLYY